MSKDDFHAPQAIASPADRDPSTNGTGASRPGDAADIFSDLAAIRLSPDDAGSIGTEEVLVQIAIRKPNVNEFARVHPDPAMSLATTICVDAERDAYFVAPALRNVMVAGGLKAILLVVTVNQRGLPFLWPLALGDGTGRRNGWHDSAREAAELAKTEWIKIVSDMPAGQYRIYRAKGKLPEPVFPTGKTMEELLRLAFRGRVIDNENHPVVKQALGLIP
jgi:hypothetical protein